VRSGDASTADATAERMLVNATVCH
jgi:hypothetical protein